MGPTLRCEDYKVGWVCALAIELAAAEEMLDEEHETPAYNDNDTNIYTCGRIGEHNVVIACLPEGQMGTISAATVAHQMKSTFPSTRFGLMVGIGGGVPSDDADVRLGDVVVSKPFGTHGGVVQYDFGKATLSGFQRSGSLNSPPAILLNAVTKVRSNHIRGRASLPGYLSKLADLPNFGREAAGSDALFEANYGHEGGATCSSCKQDCITSREKRWQEVVVHYGTIASGDQVIKNAAERDRLSKELGGVLCFEMEAAGLMNSFPCLVIRGICDYADSHKNKKWQPYAAGTAAAFAKELLSVIPSAKVEAEEKIADVLSDLHDNVVEHKLISKEHLDVAQEQLILQHKARDYELSKQQQKCLQLFRLTKTTEDATYEWYKDRVEDRVEGTCNWFLEQDPFNKWLNQVSGILLVSADPGCGKSVLAKHLIDNVLPSSATVCYFFFKDQDQNTVRQALCAILHQIFARKPSLVKHAMEQYDQNGEDVVRSTKSLWTIIGAIVQDVEAEPIIIVLDALDECAESDFEDLIHNIEEQSRQSQANRNALRFLMTSRPYRQIVESFQGLLDSFSCIHIPGEMASDSISKEVNHVVEYRVRQLAKKLKLSDEIKTSLLAALLKFENRTYLWVYLIFDHLKTQGFKKTRAGAREAIKSLPENVNQAYEKILNRSKDPLIVRKALTIIFAAERALTIAELNIAMELDSNTKSKKDLDLEDNEHFKSRLRSLCGLFVSVHHEKVYFLHQTAREFLAAELRTSASVPVTSSWQFSISFQSAHRVLAAQCVQYLSFFESEPISEYLDDLSKAERLNTKNAFLDYAAAWWPTHFAEAKLSASEDAALVHLGLHISDPESQCYSQWSRVYTKIHGRSRYSFQLNKSVPPLTITSLFGHAVLVEILLNNGADVNESETGYNALLAAAEIGHAEIGRMLIDAGAEVNAQEMMNVFNNALHAASANGHEEVVKMLIDAGADISLRGGVGYKSALEAASYKGYERIVRMLIDADAGLSAQSRSCIDALNGASWNGNERMVKMLIKAGAEVNARDDEGDSALKLASFKGHEQVVKILIDAGADVNLQGGDEFNSALQAASDQSHEQVVKILIDAGADVNLQGDWRCKDALAAASHKGHKQIIQILLDAGAKAKASDALWYASIAGHEQIVQMLLDAGAKAKGSGALESAKYGGHEQIVQMLLDAGAQW